MNLRGENDMLSSQFRWLLRSRTALEWLGAVATASVLIGLLTHRPGVYRVGAAAFALGLLILAMAFVWCLQYSWRSRGFEPSLGLLALAAVGSVALAGAAASVAVEGPSVLLGNPVWEFVAAVGVCFAVCLGGTIYLVRAGHAGEAWRADT